MLSSLKKIRFIYVNYKIIRFILHTISDEWARFRGIVKRKKIIGNYIAEVEQRKIHFGAGGNLLEGWLNTDLAPKSDTIIHIDITERLPFDDSSISYIFSEHLIEHVPHAQAAYHLSECFRVLVQGGKIRIATPDMKFLIDYYTNKELTEVQDKYLERTLSNAYPKTGFKHPAFVMNNFHRAWGHQFIYEVETLTHALENAGFKEITQYEVGESSDPVLQNVEQHGDAISNAYNKLQTMILEAVKP